MTDWGFLLSSIANVMVASGLYWHLKRHPGIKMHNMTYWQDGCLWHAKCDCGGRSVAPGGDGAEAMERVAHIGTVRFRG